MSLTNRLTLFSLAALGVVLTAFSLAIYLLAECYLTRQLDDRATATLDTLVAAAEVEGDGLEWERHNRRIMLRGDGEPPEWAAFEEGGTRIDGSDGPTHDLEAFAIAGGEGQQDQLHADLSGTRWRVVRRTMRHPRPEAVRSTDQRPRYAALVFVTAWPTAPLQQTLTTLAWSLTGVSGILWLLAGLVGHWVCRRALSPVIRMTETVGRITADDLRARLPVPTARDELHSLAAVFNELLTRLEDSFERQRRFAGEASHQLRTPLTAMLGQMEVALRRDRAPEEYRQALSSAVVQADRLRQIVVSLLFLARADADAELPGSEVIDIARWLAEFLAEFESERKADIHATAPSGLLVKVPPAMLAQVIGNLLDNAAKYSETGTPILLSAAKEDGVVTLTVEDAGHGIDPSEHDRVFEPFFRTTDTRRRGVGGVGLGLAVAARIVRSLGGHLEVASEFGRGTKFTLRLPAT